MSKPDLLLLHGALGTSKTFKPLIPILEDKFKIHTFDFIGHGSNAYNDNSLNMNNLTNQINEYLNENHLENINVFGYSMGGYAAMNLAYQHPTKIKTLFTFATKWDWNETSSAKEAAMLDVEKIMEKVPKFASYLATLHGENSWQSTTKKVQNLMLELGKSKPFDAAIFSKINTPILLGVGDRDTTVSIEETIEVYRNLPNASLFIAPKTPHAFEKVNFDLIAKIIIEFC